MIDSKCMKLILTFILVLSFIGIGVFGIFVMNHNFDHSQNCLFTLARGTDCPESGALSFINFHLGASRIFSNVVFAVGGLTSALFLLVVLIGSAVKIMAGIGLLNSPFIVKYKRFEFLEPETFSIKRKLAHWLALHEMSPTIS